MEKKKLILLIIFGVIFIGIILVFLLGGSFNKNKQEAKCYVQGPFSCKEVQFNPQNTYVLLEAEDIQEVRIIPESINISNCLIAYIDQSLLASSSNKYVKVILECPGVVKNETSGGLEMLYMTLNGDVKKSKLTFSVKIVEPLIKKIISIFEI